MKRFYVAVLFVVVATPALAWSHRGNHASSTPHVSRLSTRLTHLTTSSTRSHWGTLRRK